MRRELLRDSLPAERARGATLVESHRAAADMTVKGWTVHGGPTFTGRGMATNGVDQWASLAGTVRGVRAVAFEVYPATADEAVLALSATHSVSIVAGVVTPAGFAGPTVHVNGVATTAIAAGVRSFVTVSTATAFDADAITTGRVGAAFGEIEIGRTSLWTVQPTLGENAAYAANTMFAWQNRATAVWQCRTADRVGVQTLDSSGNGNHLTLGDGAGAGEPTQGIGSLVFDGVDDYLSGVADPAGTFTVARTATVAGGQPVTAFATDLSLWTPLMTSGAFEGVLHDLEVFPEVLNPTARLDLTLKQRQRLYREVT